MKRRKQPDYSEAKALFSREISRAKMPPASAGTASVHGQESSAINARKLVRLAGVVLLALAIAVPVAEEAIRVAEATFGKDHPKLATAVNNLAVLYDSQGEYVKAEPLYKQALEIRQKALGENDPAVATTLNDLAVLYKTEGKYADAEPLLRRALAIWEKTLGPDHPDLATSLNNLAVLYDTQGKYVEAEPL